MAHCTASRSAPGRLACKSWRLELQQQRVLLLPSSTARSWSAWATASCANSFSEYAHAHGLQ
eukprot:4541632-Alexandrium_andersonii.AAC.1